jgi:hypothetical protein
MRKKSLYFLCILLLISRISEAQLIENFNDGDFTNDPSWSATASNFIINAAFQLQSNNSVANSSYSISTPSAKATIAEWDFWVHLSFNPSSANYIDAYLTASSEVLSATSNYGYFVRIGNTDDEISLYRKNASGTIIKIIDGADDVLNTGNNTIKIKVIRNQSNQWTLYRDISGTGNLYINEGVVTDDTYTSSAYFGFLIKQSTSSFFQKHFMDDIEIKDYIPDVSPPVIVSATAISSSIVDVLFNKPLYKASSSLVSGYSVNNGLGMPATAISDAQNPSLVHLTFGNNFTNNTKYTLSINGIKDLSGNTINNETATFSFHIPQQYDIVIDELFADPAPAVGLPNYEWIELKNTSLFPINLKGWLLSNLTGSSGPLPDFVLQPDSFVIVCASASLPSLSAFGKTISVTNFPSLDNDNDLISITDVSGKTIHAVQYSSDWYQNELKKEGGWSLEMIDTKNPCSGFSNWIASKDATGGTPGRENSVDAINEDDTAPKLLRAYVPNPTTLTLLYDEPLDSLSASSLTNYTLDNGLSALHVNPIPPLFNKINITVNNPLTTGAVYTITSKNISDCAGNSIGSHNSAKVALGQDADSLDIVINEILFNPLPSGVDYVELYNRSAKTIDLSKIYIANRNSSNRISSIQQLTTENILLFPGDYIALTTDPGIVKSQYITTNPDAFLKLETMPSFSNDKGSVIILNGQGNSIDEVNYSDNWHFALLHSTRGVSLERIDYNGPSTPSNFHSAATSVGYGTPGYKNSQYNLTEETHGEITVTPETFSPDNDGTDDMLTINYQFPSAGYVANITIFDASGRPVRYLQKNSLSGIKGYYRWDGLDDKQRKLPQGIYIIYTEIFNTSGKKKAFKNTVVLARRY